MCMMNEAPEIHFHSTTTLTAEQYVAGLTDFVLAEVLLQDSRAQTQRAQSPRLSKPLD